MKKVKNDQHMRECALHIQALSTPGSVMFEENYVASVNRLNNSAPAIWKWIITQIQEARPYAIPVFCSLIHLNFLDE